MSNSDSASRWERVQSIFAAAVDLDPERQNALLSRECGGDTALRAEVESLLEADRVADRRLREIDGLWTPHDLADDGPDMAVRAGGPDDLTGSTVSHYEIEALLGSGGMGVVYRGRDTRLRRTVALKFLPSFVGADEAARQRFVREAQAASALDHPNICTIHEVGETDDGQLFIAMAHYEGETLSRLIAQGPLDVDEALDIAAQIARGLAASHAAGIVHRDIKPANVIITRPDPASARSVPKILDFGLAKMIDSDATRSTVVRGTVHYMSPEQAGGDEVDHRTDVWSLGVMLFEMLSGSRPFRGTNDPSIIHSILSDRPADLEHLRPELSRDLLHVVATCLEKSLRLRYQSAGALAGDLEAFLGRSRSGPSARLRSRRRRRHLRRGGAAAATGAVALVAALAMLEARGGPAPGPTTVDLAVLPFENLSADPADQAFVDGLVHSVTNVVTAIEEFEGRVSVVPARDVLVADVVTAAAAAERFNVDLAVSGTVQRTGEGVTVDLALVDALEGRQRSSRGFRIERERIAALPDSLVLALSELLEIELDPDVGSRVTAGGTDEPNAYELYIEARGLLEFFEVEANVDRSIDLLERAVEVDPGYTLALAALGEAYLLKYSRSQSRDPAWVARAADYAEAALEQDSTLAVAHSTHGDVLAGTGDHRRAVDAYQRALRLHPGNAFTHQALGSAYQALGAYERAEASFAKAIELRPDYWGFQRSLGHLYFVQGRFPEAQSSYRRVVDLLPNDPTGYNDVGAALERQGRYAEARDWYRQGARANPEARRSTAFALGNWAGIHYREGDFGEAVRLFEQARRADSTNVAAWQNLPNAYYWNGQNERARHAWLAIVDLERARLEVNPGDMNAAGRLADALAKTGQTDAAITVLDRNANESRNPWTLVVMALAYEYLGRRDQALDRLEAALSNGLSQATLDFHAPWMENLRTDPRYDELIGRYLGAEAG